MNDTLTLHLPCTLCDEELMRAGQQLAAANAALTQAEAQKKRVTADLTAQIQAAEANITMLTNIVQTRTEYRDVPCRMIFDSPQKGWKTIVRGDTRAIVREERMTAEEMQRDLEFSKE